MTTTAEDMLPRLKGGITTESDKFAFVEECHDLAVLIVEKHIEDNEIDEEVVDECVLRTGINLYFADEAKFGIMQYAEEGIPMRVNKDPMHNSYPILDKYMVQGLG